jgi:hypothetical protein
MDSVNPIPTFDWNIFSVWLTPLTIPTFTIMNQFVGLLLVVPMWVQLCSDESSWQDRTAAIWFTNSFNTGYIPINSNKTWNNKGGRFNVTKILTNSKLDDAKYQAYSQPWMSAGYISSFTCYFAMYGATVSYIALYHRQQIAQAGKQVWHSCLRTLRFRRQGDEDEDDGLTEDIHYKLMKWVERI